MQLLHDLKETRGHWTLKGEALDHTLEEAMDLSSSSAYK
jgi:hypothetical protein